MSEWRKVKLKDFLTQYRFTHLVQDDKYYGQITISKNNTIKFRENNIGKNIGRKRQFVVDLKKHPQTIIFTRQGVLDGSIGIAPAEVDGCIATENMPMFSINYEVIHPELLLYLIKSEMFKQKVKTIMPTGSAQKSIHERELLELDFLLPSKIEYQQKLVNTLKKYDAIILPIFAEENLNVERIKQLRQAILQEAIEGQLTADWRVNNPVCLGDPNTDTAALLATIKAEKQVLIANGKIKKEKSLAPINLDDVPFALPDGWVWVRLGQASSKITDGTHFTPKYVTTGVQFVSAKDIKTGELIFDNCKYITLEEHEQLYKRCNAEFGDLIVSKSGSIGTVVINNNHHKFSLFESLALIKYPQSNILPKYFRLALQFSCNNLKREDIRGIGVKHLHLEVLRTLLVALPPLAEQQAIVERVDRLLNHINALEQQVTERKHHAEQLMQAVLKEAFAN